MGMNFGFGCVLNFCIVFHEKSATTNNHRRGLSDISYSSPFSRNSNDSKKKFKKDRLEIFDLWKIVSNCNSSLR